MFRILNVPSLVSALAVTLVGFASSASAATLFDSNGFTSYALGNLIGQNGFEAFPTTSASFAVVDNGANRIVTAAGGVAGSQFAFPSLNYTPAANELVSVNVDFARTVGATAATSSARFGIQVFNPAGSATATGFGLNRNATTNAISIYVIAPFNATTRQFEAGQPLSIVTVTDPLVTSTFYNLEARMNYSTKIVDFYSNNTLFLGNVPFGDPAATVLGDADITVTSAVGATDTGFFDNYRVTTIVVPETNTLALLAFGAAPIIGTVIARRRKK